MAIRPLNSVAGFSVGETPANIILANGDITTTNITTTGVSNLNSISNIKISGGGSGQVIATDGQGNLSFVTISTAGLSNGTSNIAVINNGNITFSVGGNANVATVTGTGVNIAGTLNATGNANVGNIGATNGVFTNVSGNGSSLSSITGANVTGAVSFATTANAVAGANVSGQVANALVAGTVTTAAQPNITSLGTLTSLGVSGNITAANITANTGVFTGNGSGLSAITGANVTGEVSFAATANAVAGANVSGQVANALVAGTVYTNDQPNITSVGILTNLDVTGNVIANGNIAGANLTVGTGVGGTIAGANLVSANFFTGTLTTDSQPNITSVGTLTSLGVSGNITATNITANTGVFTGNGSGLTNINASNLANGTVPTARLSGNYTINVSGSATTAGTVTTNSQPNITSVGTLSSLSVTGNANVGNIGAVNAVFTGTGAFGGNVAMGNFNITGLADPINQQDAATKVYVDEVAQGLKARTAADAYSSTNLTSTYDNGTSGVGATLTATANGAFPTIDGVTLNTTTTRRLLVAGQTNAAHNGLYVLIQQGNGSTPWILRRCVECDTAEEIPGSYVFINGGNVYANTGWVASVVNPSTFVVGTDAINWIQFSGAGTFTAGTGLTLTGTVFSVNASQTQVTEVGTLIGLNVNGNITGANITANTGVFTGNAAGLTNIPGANVTGQVGNALVAGTVYTNAQPNITSVGTLTSLTVTNKVTAGQLQGEGGNISNVQGANVTGAVSFAATANAVAGANVSGQVANALVAGTVYTNAQPNITSVGILTNLDVTGNIDSGNLNTGDANFTGNILVGNGTGGTLLGANLVSANFFTGTLTTAAQPNITSVGTLTSLAVTGNTTTGNISATNGNLTTANVSGSVILGNSSVTTSISYGSVTTTSITANQTIASFSSTGVTGVEFLVKSIDSTGSKYGVATVVAVTDGTAVDFSTFATVNLGGYTGALAVNIEGGFIRLQVTPASSNSTVWTTQLRLI
jgi:hypothetical protein